MKNGLATPARRVVHVAPYYPPHVGGLEVVAKALAEGLSGDHDVDVFTSDRPRGSMSAGHPTSRPRTHRLRTVEVAHTPVMLSLPWRLLQLPRTTVVHVHAGLAFCPEVVWLTAKLRRRPFVVHFHLDSDPSGILGPLFLLYKRLVLARVLRAASHVVAVSPDQPEFLMAHYGVSHDRIVLIPNGVGAEFDLGRRTAPPVGHIPTLLFVGRLAQQKNASLLLHAVAEMKQPVRVRIVGDGEERAMLERLTRQLDLADVTFVGAKSGPDLVEEYGSADIFVMTSRKESTGLVLLEAMSAGLPVVAADAVGVRDTVGSDGLLVEPRPTALAHALDRVAGDPELWAVLAARSAARAGQHTWDASIQRLAELYEDLGADG